jgi:hypothetical protein
MSDLERDMAEQKKKMQETKKLIGIVTAGTGMLFMLFGVFCLTNIQTASEAIGIDVQTMTIIAWVLIVVGLVDLFIAKIFTASSRDTL